MASKPKKTATNAGGTATQIGAPPGAMADLVGISRDQFEHIFCLLQLFRFRDTMYTTYGINRHEMWALLSLHGYLRIKRRVIVSQLIFIRFCMSSWKAQTKMKGYMAGLKRLEAIGHFEYNRKPGSLSIGITDFGFVLIEAYYNQFYTFLATHGISLSEAQKDVIKMTSYREQAIAA